MKRSSGGKAPPESKNFRKMGLGCNPEYRDFVPNFPVAFDPLVTPPRKQGTSVYLNEGHKVAAKFRIPEGMDSRMAAKFRAEMKEKNIKEITTKKKSGPARMKPEDVLAAAGVSVDDM
jgi:hypothetical protein